MANLSNVINNTVSFSQFNRGQAGKIFNEVKKTGTKIVMKNNNPECVLMDPEQYVSLMDDINEARLILEAAMRMDDFDPKDLFSQDEIKEMFGITDDDLGNSDEVEIE